MKKRIRLTESDLHRIVKESVNRVLNEVSFGKYNTMIDKARENARLKYQRIASGKFDTPEEQQAYVDDMMSKFEDRVKGTASLYNSYGGREKKNAPQFDFNLNDPIPNEAPYSYNYGSIDKTLIKDQLKTLGYGSFGKVVLAEHKITKVRYQIALESSSITEEELGDITLNYIGNIITGFLLGLCYFTESCITRRSESFAHKKFY